MKRFLTFSLMFIGACSATFTITASAFPPPAPYSAINSDPCINVVRKVVSTVEFASANFYVLSSATLLSATQDERTFELKFSNLTGKYELILDNDRSNRCFVIQQKYIF